MEYSDGTPARIGDVLIGGAGEQRFILVGVEGGNFAKLLQIGDMTEEDSPQYGHTIVLPSGFMRIAPLGDFTLLGYADINIQKYPST